MRRKLRGYFRGISLDCLAVCVYFICVPFTVVTTPFGSLLKVITLPVAAILGYKLFFGEQKPLKLNIVHFIYAVYIADLYMGLFIYRSEAAVTQTKDMLLTFAVMLLISMRVYNEKERRLIESIWIVVGIICAAICFTSTSEHNGRTMIYILGYYEDPNQFCAYFIMPVMMCMKRIINRTRLLPVYLGLIPAMLYAILKTGSRGGLIGVVIGIVFCILLCIKSVKLKMGMLMGGLVCALLVAAVLFPLLPEKVQQRYSLETVQSDGGSGRFEIWRYLTEYTAEKPARLIFGSGMLSTFEILDGAHIPVAAGVAHNQFVQSLTDSGVMGLLIFLTLIGVCFFRNLKTNPYYACAFVSVMAFGMSLTFYVFKPYINIIIMCAMNFENTVMKGENHETA